MPSVEVSAVGIDLGTSYSCVGIFQRGGVEIIPNDQGNQTTPSCVAFTKFERLIGDPAKAQAVLNPENTVFGIKRLIGRQYEDPRIQSDIRQWPFKVVNDMGRPKVKVTYKGMIKHFHPEEISAMVLGKMKEIAEMRIGSRVTDAVITVPAYFNDSQRQATRDAGRIAGFNVLRILNEPTAAALAYGLDKNLRGERNVLVFDLGGGTFDVTVLTINRGSLFEVKATAGDTHLGGEDFDTRMVQYFTSEFKRKYGKDIEGDTKALLRLRTACEKAKKTLSSSSEATIEVDALHEGIDFYTKITRAKFEELCIDLFRSTLEPVERVLKDAKLDKDSLHDIVLIGGSTRIPKIQKMLKDFFNGRELYTSINPDEAVAYGAAVQAAILSGDTSSNIRDVLLVDVAPFSLGVEIAGGVMKKIIERSSRIPCRTSHIFVKYPLDPRGMDFLIYEGEKTMTKNNRLLGRFLVTSMSNAFRSLSQVEVTFDIDADGILHLSALEKMDCYSSQSIHIIDNKGCLSNEEISRMIIEATQYAEEDKEQRDRIMARNSLESFLYSVKQAVQESKEDKFEFSEKLAVLEICDNIIEWLDSNTLAEKPEIEHKMIKTQSELSKFMERLNFCVNYQYLNLNASDGPPTW